MRWHSLLAVILGLSVLCVYCLSPRASFAEGPPGDPGSEGRGSHGSGGPEGRDQPTDSRALPAPGAPAGAINSPNPNLHDTSLYDAALFDSSGFVRFQLIQGRLLLDPPRHRQGSQSREEPGIYESITVTARRGLPSLHYICQSEYQHLTLSVQDASTVRIESLLKATGERALLIQPAFGPIEWQSSRGELSQKLTATTLLHLRHQDSIGFDQHLEPMIRRALRGRSLAELARSTLDQMVHHTNDTTSLTVRPSMTLVRTLVDELASPERSIRVAAERELLVMGTVILPLVQTINTIDFDAEQRLRIRRIVNRLRPMTDDTPATLALMLVNDRQYWDGLSRSLAPEQLANVNSHLNLTGLASISLPDEPLEQIARRH